MVWLRFRRSDKNPGLEMVCNALFIKVFFIQMGAVSGLSAGVALAAKLNPRQRIPHALAVLALLLSAATPVFAQSVAMVTDVQGRRPRSRCQANR